MGGYAMGAVQRSQSRAASILHAYRAFNAPPAGFTEVTTQQLHQRADQQEQQHLLAESKKQVVGNIEQIPSPGGMPAQDMTPPVTNNSGLPLSLMRQLVFPADATIPA